MVSHSLTFYLAALVLVVAPVKSFPSSEARAHPARDNIIVPPFPWSRQLQVLARQISSEECDRVCEGPTKEYYEGRGCSSTESLSVCCTDTFISDYVQCNVCRRNNDQNSPDYPGIQTTLNNWGSWCASNGRPVKMAYFPGQSPPTSTSSQQPSSQTSSTRTIAPTTTSSTSAVSVQTTSVTSTGRSASSTSVSDGSAGIETSSGGGVTVGVVETGQADGIVSGGGAPRPTDQRVTEETPSNTSQSMIFAKPWDFRGRSIQSAVLVALILGAVLI